MPVPATIETAGLAPGVRFQWISRPAPTGAPRTDIAGFVGIAERGDLHRPTRIESPAQFISTFGRPVQGTYLADAVMAFFANGGQTCWVVRVADPDTAARATLNLSYPSTPDLAVVTLRATSPGEWAKRLTVDVLDLGTGRVTISLALADEGLYEQWRGVTFTPGDPNSVDVVLAGSTLVDAQIILEDRISTVEGGSSTAHRIYLLDKDKEAAVRVEQDPWDERLAFTVTPVGSGFSLDVSPTVRGGHPDGAVLSLDPNDPNYIIKAFKTEMRVRVTPLSGLDLRVANRTGLVPVAGTFTGGNDGLGSVTLQHFTGEGRRSSEAWGLGAFETIPEISILAMPDAVQPARAEVSQPTLPPPSCRDVGPAVPGQVSSPSASPTREITWKLSQQDEGLGSQGRSAVLCDAMIAQCELLRDRVAVLDPWRADLSLDEVLQWRARFRSSYAAVYYPWVLGQLTDEVKAGPPSGAIAGVLARVSLRDGCGTPPANEVLNEVAALVSSIDDDKHSRLNENSVNSIRVVNGRGIRVLGARTCLPVSVNGLDPLRYLNVRRLVAMIEAVVLERLQLYVFDDNAPGTWGAIERSVESFLEDVWRSGRFDGVSAADAFRVRCDETTNPPAAVDKGELMCTVAVRPAIATEFIFIRVTVAAGVARLEEGRSDA